MQGLPIILRQQDFHLWQFSRMNLMRQFVYGINHRLRSVRNAECPEDNPMLCIIYQARTEPVIVVFLFH